jgi:hypothetical protein
MVGLLAARAQYSAKTTTSAAGKRQERRQDQQDVKTVHGEGLEAVDEHDSLLVASVRFEQGHLGRWIYLPVLVVAKGNGLSGACLDDRDFA